MTACRSQCVKALHKYAEAHIFAPMKPSDAITKLREAGLSEKGIAAAIPVAQSTINRIHRGDMEPNYTLGKRLIEMAEALPPAESAAA